MTSRQLIHGQAQEDSAEYAMLIGGKLVSAHSGRLFEVLNPATGKRLGMVPDADASDVAAAVEAGEAALTDWRRRSPRERSKVVNAIGDVVERNAAHLALIDASGSGNPLAAMRRDIEIGLETLRYMCGIAQETKGETIPSGASYLDYTLRQPYGVVARITPFNHPLMFSLEKIAAPLVAGNCVILKPSPIGIAAPLELARLVKDVLPPGVLNVISERGTEAGAALVAHRSVKRIAFTGSAQTAQRIMEHGARHGIKAFSLELGGKNPLLVFPDVAVDEAVDAAVAGMNLDWTLGQSCGSTSRAFVHASLYEDFVEGVAERFRGLTPGLPTDPETVLGSLSSSQQLQKVQTYVGNGESEGANLVTGGAGPPGAPGPGPFFEPTLFAGVTPGMRIAKEEIFGPVLSVLVWDDPDTLLSEVNSLSYGLTANILTHDIGAAHRMAAEVEAGYIWINARDGRHFTGAPFGGFKDSGLGSETSLDELLSYTQLKNVAVWL